MTLEHPDTALTTLRSHIDGIDAKLIALLHERSQYVREVGRLKHEHAPNRCPIRPGREAEQLRRIVEECKTLDFLPAAAAHIWRMIIMASLKLEGDIRVSVYTGDGHDALYWLAREYFGPFTPFIRHPTPKRVISDVMDGKAAIGVLPALNDIYAPTWWPDLARSGMDRPNVFACLPFVTPGKPGADAPEAVAIGRIAPEPTSEDTSYFMLEAADTLSMSRLQDTVAKVGFDATWIDAQPLQPGRRHHMVEIKGFVTESDPRLQMLKAELGGALLFATSLGAYALPIILPA